MKSMFLTAASPTKSMTLDEVMGRLKRNKVVHGIVVTGSAVNKSFGPLSDYDILVVLGETKVKPRVVVTYIDSRLADMLFTTTKKIKEILGHNKLDFTGDSFEGQVIHWVKEGNILFDKGGLLKKLQKQFKNKNFPRAAEDNYLYGIWHNINYNILQNRRMAKSKDPIYAITVDVRLLYSVVQLFTSYFAFRKIPWRGEKAALRYLKQNDPKFFNTLAKCLKETNRNKKLKLYESLAKLTFPTRKLWKPFATTIVFEPEVKVNPKIVKEGLRFWERTSIK
ncbi:hypothetical protein A3H53_01255 [Candidatus Nomurabacteria bacterium RIFCSPLOWO2_02_FULL_40_10]|uniref:Polymerase nucleotidyl transferase domain-containing protein n=1 Tax=Candidatus Nomurabacteria bacterium RIFCSPLOWO2_02_FULL_40_10 TaxID=1801786 RepID=A0A1F6XWW8_9BACT|nr:MAG: hypothetical protein A3H53_01255 [Candidatus Nomurabacteria bacterium RIFCSPLOWO2_02_FULL_40_10]